jgi:uronate dehydrogenase
MKNILITGAAGGLGHILRMGLRGKYNLVRCLDIAPMESAAPGEEVIQCSLNDVTKLNDAMKNIDCVVHLAGASTENEWSKILSANIDGCFNAYDLAYRNQVRRFIFASSNHAIGFHERTETLDSDSLTRPDSRYGVSKVLGEALGQLYSDKHGMEVAVLRIGSCNPQNRPADVRQLSTWMSWRDWVHLVEASIDHPGYEFEVVYGCSDNTRKFWDNSKTVIEYHPQDNAEKYAKEVLGQEQRADKVGDLYHGGPYCTAEYTKKAKKSELSVAMKAKNIMDEMWS